MKGGGLAPHVRFPDISDSVHFQRKALDSASEGIFVQNSEGRFLYCNPAFARMLESSVEEIVGRIDSELIESACKPESPAAKQSNSQGPDREMSYEIQRGSRQFEVRKIPYTADAGSVAGVIGYLKDVTETRRAEALRLLQLEVLERIAKNAASEEIFEELISFIERTFAIYSRQAGLLDTRLDASIERVEHLAGLAVEHHQSKPEPWSGEREIRVNEKTSHQILDSLPLGVFIHDGHRMFYANPIARELIGVATGDDLSKLDPFDVVHPEFREMARERVASIMQTGEVLSPVEAAIIRTDGSTLEVEVQSIPTRFVEQPCVLVSFYDITLRKQFARDLMQQKEYLQGIFQATPECIKVVDQDGSLLEMNEAGCAMIQATSNDGALGCSVFDRISPKDLARFKAFHQAICRGERGVLEFEIVGLYGKRRLMESHAVPLELNGRKVHLAVSRDITDRKRLEEQVRQVQKMEAVGRLAGGIAHDFNNLLTVIIGYCDLLLMSLTHSSNDPSIEAVLEIREAGERAQRLTNQLLAYSRKAVFERKPFDLNEMLDESTTMLRRLIGEDVAMTFVSSQSPANITGDPGQLEQVILNLVINARDAMPKGGRLTIETRNVLIEPGRVEFTDLPPGPYVELRVSDTGAGIDPQHVDTIFEPFFTTKGVGQGTGLGLSVVDGVVKQMGGAISVDSTVGSGTTFRILFPSMENSIQFPEIAQNTSNPFGREAILLVEDEESVRRIASLALEAQGYTVLVASNGGEALRISEEYPRAIQLLVTDVVMPGLGGRDLSEAIRSTRPEISVLYMSGYTDDSIIRQGIEVSAEECLQKPFTPIGLARKVRSVLDRSVQ